MTPERKSPKPPFPARSENPAKQKGLAPDWFEKAQFARESAAHLAKDIEDAKKIAEAAQKRGLQLYKRKAYVLPEDHDPKGALPHHFFVGAIGEAGKVEFVEHNLKFPIKDPKDFARMVSGTIALYQASEGPFLHGAERFKAFVKKLSRE